MTDDLTDDPLPEDEDQQTAERVTDDPDDEGALDPEDTVDDVDLGE